MKTEIKLMKCEPLIFFVVLVLSILAFTSYSVSASQQGIGVFNLSQTAVNGATYYDINHYNFSARIFKSGTANVTGMSRRVENSDNAGPSVVHNKTSILYPGDVVDLIVGDGTVGGSRDTLFLQRPMTFYNKSGVYQVLTTSNANSSSCVAVENSSARKQIDCTYTNDDVDLVISYIADNSSQQFFSFSTMKSTTSSSLISVGHANYLDYDIAVVAGEESEDEITAIVNSSQFGAGTEEQIVREGIVMCDSAVADEIDLQKCSDTTNDTFTIKQHLGTGSHGNDIFVGASVEFRKGTAVRSYIAFTNPSTDTDGKREVPPEEINVTSTSTMNKNDDAFVIRIVDGNLTKIGATFKKFFGNSYGTTNLLLNARATERVGSREFSFINTSVVGASTGVKLSSAGAYTAINFTAEFANTGSLDIVNGNATCNITHSDGTSVLKDSFIFNITATEPTKGYQCGNQGAGVTINQNNSIKPGNYTISWGAVDHFDEKATALIFPILTDFEGTTASSATNKNYTCNENITFNYNLTNDGNQNFTANLLVNLSLENKTFVQEVENTTVTLIKDAGNGRSVIVRYCNEWPQNITLNVTYTIEEEAQGAETRRTSVTRRVLGNAFSTFYGSVFERIGLRSDPGNVLFSVPSTNTSNIYVVDSNSKIDFSALQAFGRTTSNTTAGTDFTELDQLFNISLNNQGETVSSLYSLDGTAPKNTESFKIGDKMITAIPIVNTTTSGVYTTGILWDTSDDTSLNGEFNTADNEDVAFVIKVRKSQTTSLGTADYVAYIPSFIRNQVVVSGGGSPSTFISKSGQRISCVIFFRVLVFFEESFLLVGRVL